MCVFSTTVHPKTAESDIVCYKMFDFNSLDGLIRTPVVRVPVCELGELKGITIKPKCPNIAPGYDLIRNLWMIGNGFIHAHFKRPISIFRSSVICQCVIPKGSTYFVDTNYATLCASELKVTRILNKRVNFLVRLKWLFKKKTKIAII